MKKLILVSISLISLLVISRASALYEQDVCQWLVDELGIGYEQMRETTTDFKPSTYNDPLKFIESQATKSRNQSDLDISWLDDIIDSINKQVNLLGISDLDKQFYTTYITHQIQYNIRSQNCLPAKTYTAYKKLYDKIISNLKKYWWNDLSNSQKVSRLEMINDKLDLIDKYSWYKYNQIISYLHIEINKYITYIIRLQS